MATTAGYRITIQSTRVVISDEHGHEHVISNHEARELAQRLLHAAAAAERAAHPRPAGRRTR